MTVPQSITSELQKVAPSSIIELFVLQLNTAQHGGNDTYRFHAGVNGKNDYGNIVWAGQTYQALPVEMEGFEYSGNGQLPRPKIRVSNQFGLISAILISINAVNPGNDLIGAKLTRIRTCARYLDAVNFPGNSNPLGTPDSTAEFPREVYFVSRKVVENRDMVEFECAAAFDLQGVRAPRRQCIANICQWTYRSAECGYTSPIYFDADDLPVDNASQDACGKRLSSCEVRFGPVKITGNVTAGSTTMSSLSTAELYRIKPGEPIEGFGVPSGTVITAEGTGSLTLSQPATASTTVTRTGTLNTTGTAITVSSTADLAVGMTVSGTNVPSGTTIASISGTTINLSIAYNPASRGSQITRAVEVYKTFVFGSLREYWNLSPTTGILVGDLAGNSSGISDTQPHGANVYAGTKVFSIESSASRVQIDKYTKFDNRSKFTAVFWRPVTFTSASYTFTASPSYVVRPRGRIPFGSFPGAGTFIG